MILIASVLFAFTRTEQFLGRVSIVHASMLYRADAPPQDIEAILLQSNNYATRDDTYRALAQFYSSMLGRELARLESVGDVTEAESSNLKSIWDSAELNAVLATKLEPNRVENWKFLGNFYLDAVAIGVEGSLENAELAYQNSLTLSPNDPGAYVSLAEIAYRNSDLESGDAYVAKALELSPTFSSALMLKGQIDQIQSAQQDIPDTDITASDEIVDTE